MKWKVRTHYIAHEFIVFSVSVSLKNNEIKSPEIDGPFLFKKDTRAQAEEWAEQHRCKYPALYNVARLTELPLPEQPNQNREEIEDIVEQLSIDRISIGDEAANAANETLPVREKSTDPLPSISETGNVVHEIITISSDDEDEDGAYGGPSANINSLVAIKDDSDTPDENARSSIENAHQNPQRRIKVPPPVSCKLEYDDMSGYIPFIVKVSEMEHSMESMTFILFVSSFSIGIWSSAILLSFESVHFEIVCTAVNWRIGYRQEG